jgi:hypothetical protein
METARRALIRTGLCHGRDEDIAFVEAALAGNKFAKGIGLRRHGTQIEAAALRAMKIRANASLTAEYLAILTPAGREDPIRTAQVLVSAYLSCLAGTNAAGRAAHAGIELVEVIPNNMAAGPCAACLQLARKPIPLADAPAGPLSECPHPDQCVLRWQSHLMPA